MIGGALCYIVGHQEVVASFLPLVESEHQYLTLHPQLIPFIPPWCVPSPLGHHFSLFNISKSNAYCTPTVVSTFVPATWDRSHGAVEEIYKFTNVSGG